jgi:hypothetical protein
MSKSEGGEAEVCDATIGTDKLPSGYFTLRQAY